MNNIKKINIINKVIFMFVLLIVLYITFSSVYGASAPTLVNKLNTAFKRIQEYLVKLATPAAGVAIASGVFMRKLSFGNEEKMVMGKKVIINAIISYAIIISIDLILKFIDSVLD